MFWIGFAVGVVVSLAGAGTWLLHAMGDLRWRA